MGQMLRSRYEGIASLHDRLLSERSYCPTYNMLQVSGSSRDGVSVPHSAPMCGARWPRRAFSQPNPLYYGEQQMKKLLTIIAGLLLSFNVYAGGQPCTALFGSPCSQSQGQDQGQAQKQGQAQGQAQGQSQAQKASAAAASKANAAALGVGVAGAAAGVIYAPNIAAAKIPDNSAIAPNPSAAPPSAACWIGASVTAAVMEFGIGVSGMEWDPICGLWLAAQQVDGPPQKEAATAAFCMTMKKANVNSVTCTKWHEDQTEYLVGLDSNNRADVVFSPSGGYGR